MKQFATLVGTTVIAICLFAALSTIPASAQSSLPPFRLQADTSIAVSITLTNGQTILVPIDLTFVTRNEPEGMYISLDATTKPQPGTVVTIANSRIVTASAQALTHATPLPVTTSVPDEIAAAPAAVTPSTATEPTATQPPPTVAPAPTSTPVPTPIPPSGNTSNPGINTDVMVGDIKWRVVSAEELGNRLTSDNMFVDDAVTSGRFVRVRVEIDNRGTSGAPYWGPSIVDDRGREYEDYSGQYFFIDDADGCMLLTLNPGLSKQCVHIYEVAGDSQGLQLKVSDFALFFAEEALIDLR